MKKLLSFILTSLIFVTNVYAKDLRFAQISDVRYSANEENIELQNIIKEINKDNKINFVVFTGDNIIKPSKVDLEAFIKEAKKLDCPFYLVIGEKDVNQFKHFDKKDYIKTLNKNIRRYKIKTPNYSFEKNGVIFVVADGAKEVISDNSGYYKDDVLNWLDEELSKYPENSIIILQHFPVIPPAEKVSYYTYRANDYLKIVSKYKNVKAIISGHFGVNNEKSVNGIQHISTQGMPYYRIIDIIDSETNTPIIWAELKKVD